MSEQQGYQEIQKGDVSFWNPKEPEEVEGILIEEMHDVGDYNSDAFKLRPIDGGEKDIIVTCNNQLKDLLGKVPMGDTVLIKFTGYRKSEKSGREYKFYRVFSKPTPQQEVSSEQSKRQPQQSQQQSKPEAKSSSGSNDSGPKQVGENIFVNKQGFLVNNENLFVDVNGKETGTPLRYEDVKDQLGEEDDMPF